LASRVSVSLSVVAVTPTELVSQFRCRSAARRRLGAGRDRSPWVCV